MLNNFIKNIKKGISIAKPRSWLPLFLNYYGFINQATIHLRTGIIFKVHEVPPIHEIWIKKRYTPFRNSIPAGSVIIDIGAHIGTFTIFAATQFKDTKVYSYEPAPDNFRLLKENVKLNNLVNVKIFDKGVAGTKGKKKLYVEDRSIGYTIFTKGKNQKQKYVEIECLTLGDIFKENKIKNVIFYCYK